MEALDQLITCNHEGSITNEELQKGRELFTEARALLENHIDYLSKVKGDNMLREPLASYGAPTVGLNASVSEDPTHNQSTHNTQPVTE